MFGTGLVGYDVLQLHAFVFVEPTTKTPLEKSPAAMMLDPEPRKNLLLMFVATLHTEPVEVV